MCGAGEALASVASGTLRRVGTTSVTSGGSPSKRRRSCSVSGVRPSAISSRCADRAIQRSSTARRSSRPGDGRVPGWNNSTRGMRPMPIPADTARSTRS